MANSISKPDSVSRPVHCKLNSKNKSDQITKQDKSKTVTKNSTTTIVSWNIRRGLICREAELKEILLKNRIGIIFLVETDVKEVNAPEDYIINGYSIVVQMKENATD